MTQIRLDALEHVDFDQYVTLSEKEARSANRAADDAFIAAVMKAAAKGRENVNPGVYIDNSPPINARRIRAEVPLSACGSPARMCAEVGARGDGAQTMR